MESKEGGLISTDCISNCQGGIGRSGVAYAG